MVRESRGWKQMPFIYYANIRLREVSGARRRSRKEKGKNSATGEEDSSLVALAPWFGINLFKMFLLWKTQTPEPLVRFRHQVYKCYKVTILSQYF